MAEPPGIIRPELQALPQIKDRMTFLYLEHCTLGRQDGAITVTDDRGIVHIPAAAITVLLLGPGTRVTHRAIELMGDSGVGIVWVGEHGVRYYAHGRPLTTRVNLLLRQAELVSNTRKHLDVVRKMYQLRFPNEDVSHLTMQQLRGREGSRVRRAYRAASQKTGVPWNGRDYRLDDFSASDKVNQALSAGHACLYGLAHAVIVSLGCSPASDFPTWATINLSSTTSPICTRQRSPFPLPLKWRQKTRKTFPPSSADGCGMRSSSSTFWNGWSMTSVPCCCPRKSRPVKKTRFTCGITSWEPFPTGSIILNGRRMRHSRNHNDRLSSQAARRPFKMAAGNQHRRVRWKREQPGAGRDLEPRV